MQYSEFDHKSGYTPQQLARLKELLACQNVALLAKSAGGNSKVFCVEADGERWAVKSYPPHNANQRDRLTAEVAAYEFLNEQRVPAVPKLKAFCDEQRWLVMSWIDGSLPKEYSASDIDQAIQFIRSISALNARPEAVIMLPQAAEACLSLTILLDQITRRYQRLMALPEQDAVLIEFLTTLFLPVFEQYQKRAIDGYRKHQLDPESELPQEQRSLIPADFGFHNAIRDSAGRLYFFDFDYFGWDDPVKLLADILWHPKMQLTEQQEQRLVQGITNIYRADPAFSTRFAYTYPLFGLRWVLILLNEFIADYWLNRQHAEVHQDQEQAKKTQLERARVLLMKTVNCGACHPERSEGSLAFARDRGSDPSLRSG